MRERPILFSGPMVRAILAGTKTQTRRVVKKQPAGAWAAPGRTACPYGQPGDRLWVKETFRFNKDFDADSPSRVAERCLDAGYRLPWAPVQYEADRARANWQHTSTPPHDGPPVPGKTRVSIHMPRWASRLTLEITSVRVERLQDISEDDARAEGVAEWARGAALSPEAQQADPISQFCLLWGSVHSPSAWFANPFVWVVAFRRLPQTI